MKKEPETKSSTVTLDWECSPREARVRQKKEVRQEGRANARWCIAKLITALQKTRWLLSHVGRLWGQCKEQLSVHHGDGRVSNLFAGSCLSPLSH